MQLFLPPYFPSSFLLRMNVLDAIKVIVGQSGQKINKFEVKLCSSGNHAECRPAPAASLFGPHRQCRRARFSSMKILRALASPKLSWNAGRTGPAKLSRARFLN